MQYLEMISQSPQASWYRLRGDYEGNVHRWVTSTPQTIRVCNQSDLVGVEFSDVLREGVAASTRESPFLPFLSSVPCSQLCIMNFLRGSLNFDLRHVLHDSLGSNFHATCFMSSQRYRQEGRWHVKEDMYRKIRIPKGAILLVGDVVATGVTVDNGLEVIVKYLEEHKSWVRGLVFYTLGCHKLEKILEKYHERFSQLSPEYQETHLVYLEGKFRLVDSATRLMVAIQGTDLIKRHALVSPEFEASQYDTLGAPLERCVIYDAGSRAFDVREYIDDVTEYWEQVRRLSRRGYTLKEALKERWPEQDYVDSQTFLAHKQQAWPGLPGEFLDSLYQRYLQRWSDQFRTWSTTREALETVCEDRLQTLRAIQEKF